MEHQIDSNFFLRNNGQPTQMVNFDTYLGTSNSSLIFTNNVDYILSNLYNPQIFNINFDVILNNIDKILHLLDDEHFLNLLFSNINKNNVGFVLYTINRKYLELISINPKFNNKAFYNLLLKLNNPHIVKISSQCKARLNNDVWFDLVCLIMGSKMEHVLYNINSRLLKDNLPELCIDDYIYILRYKSNNDLNILSILIYYYIETYSQLSFNLILEFISQLSDMNIIRAKDILYSHISYNYNINNLINNIKQNSNDRVRKLLG